MLRIFPPTDSFSAEDLFRGPGHIAVKSGVGNNRAGLRTVRRTGPPATPYWTDRFGGPSGWRTADRLGCRSPEHHRSDWEACENAHFHQRRTDGHVPRRRRGPPPPPPRVRGPNSARRQPEAELERCRDPLRVAQPRG